MAEFTKQRDTLMETAQSDRRNQVFEDYLAGVQQRMKQDGDIKVYAEVLAQYQEAQPDIDLPTRPQIPTQ
jgi:hypothetical protein